MTARFPVDQSSIKIKEETRAFCGCGKVWLDAGNGKKNHSIGIHNQTCPSMVAMCDPSVFYVPLGMSQIAKYEDMVAQNIKLKKHELFTAYWTGEKYCPVLKGMLMKHTLECVDANWPNEYPHPATFRWVQKRWKWFREEWEKAKVGVMELVKKKEKNKKRNERRRRQKKLKTQSPQ